MAELGLDSLLQMVGAQYDKSLIGKISNGFSDAFSSSISQWFNDIRMRNRVGKEAYKEGQKSAWNQQTGLDLTNAQRQVMEYNSQEAENAWNRQMAYERDKYNIQTQSMKDAGLNPAMVYGGGNLVQTSANGQQASAGMPSPSNGFGEMMSVMSNMAMLGAQQSLMRAQGRLANAQANAVSAGVEKTLEETEGQRLSNEWQRDTMDDRKESVRLQNDISRADRRKIDSMCDEIAANIQVLVEKASTEREQQAALAAKAAYDRANAYEIIAMLPFHQRAMAAQANRDNASASLANANAAVAEVQALIQNKLYRSDYFDNQIKIMEAEAATAKEREVIAQLGTAIRSGKWITIDENDPEVKQFLQKAANRILASVAAFNDNFNPIASTNFGSVSFSTGSNESHGTGSSQGTFSTTTTK